MTGELKCRNFTLIVITIQLLKIMTNQYYTIHYYFIYRFIIFMYGTGDRVDNVDDSIIMYHNNDDR